MTLLAQIAPEGAMNWQVLLALGVLASVALNVLQLFRGMSGTADTRQIEPTVTAGIVAELKRQTEILNKLDREQGITGSTVEAISDELGRIRGTQRQDTEGLYKRVNAISEDLSAVKARVDIIEKKGGA